MATPQGIGFGIMVGIADVLIWRHFVPTVADIRTAPAHDSDLEKAERTALLVGTGFTLLVAGFAKSAEVFAIGGSVLIALDFATKHANAVNPTSGKMEASDGVSTTYPMPDYMS
jgi:hypothetical protein